MIAQYASTATAMAVAGLGSAVVGVVWWYTRVGAAAHMSPSASTLG